MKKKKTTGKRLELNRQTIRTLQEGTLSEVHGGLWSCTCSQGSCASGCCAPYSDVCSGPICVNAHVIR